jgi:hypothetical protein
MVVTHQLRDEAGGLGAVKGARAKCGSSWFLGFSGSSGGSALAFRMTSKTCRNKRLPFLDHHSLHCIQDRGRSSVQLVGDGSEVGGFKHGVGLQS